MSSKLTARWLPPVTLACAAVIEAAVFAVQGDVAAAVVAGGLLLALMWWLWPSRGRVSTSHQAARERHARDGTVVVYWRPGCTYCTRLRLRLGKARRRAIWINVWGDDEAVSFVRLVNDGNETVPTVLLAGGVRTNPDPAEVRQALGASDRVNNRGAGL